MCLQGILQDYEAGSIGLGCKCRRGQCRFLLRSMLEKLFTIYVKKIKDIDILELETHIQARSQLDKWYSQTGNGKEKIKTNDINMWTQLTNGDLCVVVVSFCCDKIEIGKSGNNSGSRATNWKTSIPLQISMQLGVCLFLKIIC